jgi:hypothetical protein
MFLPALATSRVPDSRQRYRPGTATDHLYAAVRFHQIELWKASGRFKHRPAARLSDQSGSVTVLQP